VRQRALTYLAANSLERSLLEKAYRVYGVQSAVEREPLFEQLQTEHAAERTNLLNSRASSSEIAVTVVADRNLQAAFAAFPELFRGVGYAFSRFVLTQDAGVRRVLEAYSIPSFHLVHLSTRVAAGILTCAHLACVRCPMTWYNDEFSGVKYLVEPDSEIVRVYTSDAGCENVYNDRVSAIKYSSITQTGLSRLIPSSYSPSGTTFWLFNYVVEQATPSGALFFDFDNTVIFRRTALAGGEAAQFRESTVMYRDTEWTALNRLISTVCQQKNVADAISAAGVAYHTTMSAISMLPGQSSRKRALSGSFSVNRETTIASFAQNAWTSKHVRTAIGEQESEESLLFREHATYSSRMRRAVWAGFGVTCVVAGMAGMAIIFVNRKRFAHLWEGAFNTHHYAMIRKGELCARIDDYPGHEGENTPFRNLSRG